MLTTLMIIGGLAQAAFAVVLIGACLAAAGMAMWAIINSGA